MAAIRLGLLLMMIGSLTLLILQNQSPYLPLVFLGMRTQALPLGLWILVAIALGVITSLLLAGLFWGSNVWAAQTLRSQMRELTLKLARSSYRPGNPVTDRSPRRSAPEEEIEEFEDWEDQGAAAAAPVADVPDSPYETRQQPQTTVQSGSTYSYSYRDSKPDRPRPPDPPHAG
ncbi:LapA family protein [Neosynechococcus sphagnicola]|uniref:LapA family protein n=1 Tax=Neosynechococcus sphagnicola TaxID=1501145 RepID=UPI0019552865|nr:LapA family protein [Neosynechococcus sphagnicola]